MAIDWAAARTKVRGDLWRPGSAGVPDDVCDRAIHAALLELESQRRWLWLEAVRRPVVLAVAADTISIPADIVSLESVTLVRIDGRLEDPLAFQTIARVRAERSQSTVSSVPTAYAIGNAVLYFDGTVKVGETVELIGKVRTPDDIDAAIVGATTNVTLQLQQAIVIACAAAEVSQGYLKNDMEFMRQRAKFERGVERLEREDDEKRADTFGGLIQPDTTYRDMAGSSYTAAVR